MTRPDLNDLAERVEQGSGNQIAYEIALSFGLAPKWWSDILASIEAVERLRTKLLPGSQVSILQDETITPKWCCRIQEGGVNYCGNAGTEPRARLAAILRALAAKEG